MSWKVTSPVKERARFCLEWEELRSHERFNVHCDRYGISRKTGYKWLGRYLEDGLAGLEDRSHAAHSHSNVVEAQLEQEILEVRQQHPNWGPKKLLGWLGLKQSERHLPAASTVGDILKRQGLVCDRKIHRRVGGQAQHLCSASAPNDVWCADFKGWWRTQDGSRCEPMTVTDQASRYIIRCNIMLGGGLKEVKSVLEASFRELGLPRVIRTDNGPPFAAPGLTGLSQLSVWWILLGIQPERIELGKPQQNGRHERMHGTMAREVESAPARDLKAQQRILDDWREEFNHVRPHEALGQVPPACMYTVSQRSYPRRLPKVHYDTGVDVRSVDCSGKFRWKGSQLFVSHALADQPISIGPDENGLRSIHFSWLEVAVLNERKLRMEKLSKVSG